MEPGNDRSLEPWTNCPVCLPRALPFTADHHLYQAFEKHIAAFHASPEFVGMAAAAGPFFNGIRDFVFGQPTTLENIVRIPASTFL